MSQCHELYNVIVLHEYSRKSALYENNIIQLLPYGEGDMENY